MMPVEHHGTSLAAVLRLALLLPLFESLAFFSFASVAGVGLLLLGGGLAQYAAATPSMAQQGSIRYPLTPCGVRPSPPAGSG